MGIHRVQGERTPQRSGQREKGESGWECPGRKERRGFKKWDASQTRINAEQPWGSIWPLGEEDSR